MIEPIHFECVWKSPSAPEIEQVKELWRKYRAIESEDVIAQRATQLVYVIKDSSGEVGGVSTVRPVRAALLNNHFFYEFRCFVAPGFRGAGLDAVLAKKTREFLEEQPDSVTKFKGLMMIVENESLRKQRTKAVWPASGMVFVGYNSRGHHVRVGYFKGARI